MVSFCPDLKFPGGALLGQYGFLSHFNVGFHQADNFFELQPCKREIEVPRETSSPPTQL
jgi:hypothetical protein